MTQPKLRVFPVLLAALLALGAGCSSHCVLLRSEYYDVTGQVFPPVPALADIPVLTEAPSRPYLQIGVVTVEAPLGTGGAAIDAEMKARARRVGGNALIRLAKDESQDSKTIFCGKVFTTKKSVTVKGAVIVYTDKEPDA